MTDLTASEFAARRRQASLEMEQASIATAEVIGVAGSHSFEKLDYLAVEEPLGIAIGHGPLVKRMRSAISVTMRTPGNDRELAAGLLVAEGIVRKPEEILAIEMVRSGTMVRIDLHPDVSVDLDRLNRFGFTSSACGICGKTAIDAVETACDGPPLRSRPLPVEILRELPERLRESQLLFASTGGLHGAALFDLAGNLLGVREDIGRHNAVDKLIGAEFLAGRLPLNDRVLLVSGRAGFELIQKAAVAGIAIFAAVGAPSSLAVELATRVGMTAIGFLREDRFNIYSGDERIAFGRSE